MLSSLCLFIRHLISPHRSRGILVGPEDMRSKTKNIPWVAEDLNSTNQNVSPVSIIEETKFFLFTKFNTHTDTISERNWITPVCVRRGCRCSPKQPQTALPSLKWQPNAASFVFKLYYGISRYAKHFYLMWQIIPLMDFASGFALKSLCYPRIL